MGECCALSPCVHIIIHSTWWSPDGKPPMSPTRSGNIPIITVTERARQKERERENASECMHVFTYPDHIYVMYTTLNLPRITKENTCCVLLCIFIRWIVSLWHPGWMHLQAMRVCLLDAAAEYEQERKNAVSRNSDPAHRKDGACTCTCQEPYKNYHKRPLARKPPCACASALWSLQF